MPQLDLTAIRYDVKAVLTTAARHTFMKGDTSGDALLLLVAATSTGNRSVPIKIQPLSLQHTIKVSAKLCAEDNCMYV